MKKTLLALLLTCGLNTIAQAVDLPKFMQSILATKAASKAVAQDEGRDIDKFRTAVCSGMNPWGQPLIKNEKLMERSLFLCRTSYSVQYDTLYKTPLWASEVLLKFNFSEPIPKDLIYHPINPDPDLPVGMQVNLADYKGTGYEAVSLAPVADLYIAMPTVKPEVILNKNQFIIDEGIYASNTLPMATGLKSLWRQLEIKIRLDLNKPNKNQFFIVTGPIYANGKTKGNIGKNGTPIPTHFYKIVVDPDINGSISYIIPNENLNCNQNCDLNSYVVNMREIERLTGFEFFPKLAPHYATKVKLDPNLINKKIDPEAR